MPEAPPHMLFIARAMKRGRLAHAYLLFAGEYGALERELTALARLLLCSSPDLAGAAGCGRCGACRKVDHSTHPDLAWIGSEGGQVRIDAVKEFRSQVAFPPLAGERRVAVFPDAHRLNVESANAMLKVLEEPPPYLVFLLGAPQGASILKTIRSRCHLLFSPRPDDAAITGQAGGEVDMALLRMAHGDMAKVGLWSSPVYSNFKERFLRMVEAGDSPEGLLLALTLAQECGADEDGFGFMVHLSACLARDVLALRAGAEAFLVLPERVVRLAASRAGFSEVSDYVSWLSGISLLQDRNINRQFMLEKLLLFWLGGAVPAVGN